MRIKKILHLLVIVVFLYSFYYISDYFYESYKNNKIYGELRILYHSQMPDPDNNDTHIMERYLPLLQINEDIIGWLTVPGTVIDYPVVQTDNNDYYLSHNIDGEESRAGSIFIDFRNNIDKSNKNTILYGHNMRDGSMFRGLMQFKKKDFFEQNTIIQFNTLYDEREWEVFSAYVTGTSFYYLETGFNSDESFLNFIKTLKDKSMHRSDVDLKSNDSIITLSTCSYEFEDARFVVHAKMIK